MCESEEVQSSANPETFNCCLICQAEVSKGSFSNLKSCQKFLTLASRYYNIYFPSKSVNLQETIELNQLKFDGDFDCDQLVSCNICSEKINLFCKIYEEFSLLQIQLDASARKITELMKDVQMTKFSNSNGPTPDSEKFAYFRNQLYSRAKVAQPFPRVKLRKLEMDHDDGPKFENDPLYLPAENENSGNEGEDDTEDTDIAQMDHNHSFADSLTPPPAPPTNIGTELILIHHANETEKVAKISSVSATGNGVEIIRSSPVGPVTIVRASTSKKPETEPEAEAIPEPEPCHKCSFCDKTFKNQYYKNRHENIHRLPHQCRFCNRMFPFKSNRTIHERTHTGIKPFKCSVCAKTFREKAHCQTHIWNVHQGIGEVVQVLKTEQESKLVKVKIEANLVPAEDVEKPFKCSICQKGFANSKLLDLHQRTHVKPFKCGICGARFSVRSGLEVHERSHTGERPYFCAICFQNFPHRAACRSHQRSVHKIFNGKIIETQACGVLNVVPVPVNILSLPIVPIVNQIVTPGNQPVHEIQGTDNLQYVNGGGVNLILPDTQQEVEMELMQENDVTGVDIKLEDPLGDV